MRVAGTSRLNSVIPWAGVTSSALKCEVCSIRSVVTAMSATVSYYQPEPLPSVRLLCDIADGQPVSAGMSSCQRCLECSRLETAFFPELNESHRNRRLRDSGQDIAGHKQTS